MKDTDDLFQLIKSLTKSEKRYFRLSNSLEGRSQDYMRLYDILEKKNHYDSKSIIGILTKRKDPIASRYALVKHTLYTKIFDCLRSLHAHDGIGQDLDSSIMNVKILRDKRLFDQANIVCSKAIKKADMYELYLPKVTLLFAQKTIATYSSEGYKHKDAVLNDLFESVDLFNQLCYYSEKSDVIDREIISEQEMNAERKKYLRSFIKKIPPPKTNSFRINLNYLNALATASNLLKDYKSFYLYSKKLVFLSNQNPDISKKYSDYYLVNITNFIEACFNMKYYDEIKVALKELEDFTPVAYRHQVKKQYFYYLSYLNLQNALFEHKGIALEDKNQEEIILWLKKNNDIIPKYILFEIIFLIAYLYFKQKNYKKCIETLNKILLYKRPPSGIRPALIGHCQLLRLIAYLESGFFDLFNSELPKVKYFFLSHNINANEIEQLFILLKKISDNNFKNINKICNKEVNNFTAIDSHGPLFNIRKWVEKKGSLNM